VRGIKHTDGEESLEIAYFSPDSLPEEFVCDHAIRIRDTLSGREAAYVR